MNGITLTLLALVELRLGDGESTEPILAVSRTIHSTWPPIPGSYITFTAAGQLYDVSIDAAVIRRHIDRCPEEYIVEVDSFVYESQRELQIAVIGLYNDSWLPATEEDMETFRKLRDQLVASHKQGGQT